MKKIVGIIIAIMVLALGAINVAAADKDNVTVKVDGNIVDCQKYGALATIIEGRTMVPLRAIFEALGADVQWDAETSTAIGTKGMLETEFTVGNTTYYINGIPMFLDVPPITRNSRTLVPVRAISESFGCDVSWDKNTYTVEITRANLQLMGDEDWLYYGEVANGLAHGYGYLEYPNEKYIGNFENGKLHGKVTACYPGGEIYVGNFNYSEEHGQGTVYFADGDIYVGAFENGQMHGQGTYYFSNGDIYEGAFENGKMQGQCVYYLANGDKYVGGYANGAVNGYGTLYFADGSTLTGMWEDGSIVVRDSEEYR